MSKTEKFSLRNDYVFKRTFTKDGSTGLLKDFLEAILEEKITGVEVRNNEIPKDLINEKACILDIRAEVNGKYIVDIEMQVGNKYNLRKRATVYMCKNISTQIQRTEDYKNLKKSIVIFILNDILFKRNGYHHVAHMKFEKTKENEYMDMGYDKEEEIATNELEMHFLEIPKFIKKNPGVEGKLEQWMWLICGKEEKIKMAEKKNEKIKRAADLVVTMSMDPKEREIYEDMLIAKFNYDSGMYEAREDGIKAGEKRKELEIAKKLKKSGMKLEDIINITGVSKKELAKL